MLKFAWTAATSFSTVPLKISFVLGIAVGLLGLEEAIRKAGEVRFLPIVLTSLTAIGGLLPTPFVHTVHGPVDGHPGDLYERVVQMAPGARLISLSLSQRKPRPELPWVANVPNALELSFYPYRRERGGRRTRPGPRRSPNTHAAFFHPDCTVGSGRPGCRRASDLLHAPAEAAAPLVGSSRDRGTLPPVGNLTLPRRRYGDCTTASRRAGYRAR